MTRYRITQRIEYEPGEREENFVEARTPAEALRTLIKNDELGVIGNEDIWWEIVPARNVTVLRVSQQTRLQIEEMSE